MQVTKITLNALNTFRKDYSQNVNKEVFRKDLACSCPPRKLELDTFKRSNK